MSRPPPSDRPTARSHAPGAPLYFAFSCTCLPGRVWGAVCWRRWLLGVVRCGAGSWHDHQQRWVCGGAVISSCIHGAYLSSLLSHPLIRTSAVIKRSQGSVLSAIDHSAADQRIRLLLALSSRPPLLVVPDLLGGCHRTTEQQFNWI
jgi:hypothetical protein